MTDPEERLPPHPRYPAALDAAIWMMPDDDLRAIDEMASTSQARKGAIGYYLDEWDRRQTSRLNRLLARLTWWIAALTLLVLAVAVITLVVALQD
jgi:hypothetical protein